MLVLGKDSEPCIVLELFVSGKTAQLTYLDQFLGHGRGRENARFCDDA